jgi:hemerythrin
MKIRWTAQLSVGNEVIDAQHRVLIERVAALGEAIQRGDWSEVGRMVAYLGDYALGHFEEEERIMRERSYPGFAKHNAAHLAFVHAFLEIERDYRVEGAREEVARRMHGWLHEWLEEHLAGEDRELGHFMRRGAAHGLRTA